MCDETEELATMIKEENTHTHTHTHKNWNDEPTCQTKQNMMELKFYTFPTHYNDFLCVHVFVDAIIEGKMYV